MLDWVSVDVNLPKVSELVNVMIIAYPNNPTSFKLEVVGTRLDDFSWILDTFVHDFKVLEWSPLSKKQKKIYKDAVLKNKYE